jgi:Cu+-exporting ATPase
MPVTPGRSAYPLEYQGATYHFCGAGCRREFEKDPAAYLKRETHADQK